MDPNFNEKLIEEVRKHDCLYNLGSPDYRNTIKKDKIWTDIGGTMQSTGKQNKINLLKYTYMYIFFFRRSMQKKMEDSERFL